MSRRDRYWQQRDRWDRLFDPVAWWLTGLLFRGLEQADPAATPVAGHESEAA